MGGKFKLLFLMLLVGMAMLLSGCGAISNAAATDPSIELLYSLFGSDLQGSLQCSSGSTCYNAHYVFPTLVHSFNLAIIAGAMMIFAYIAIMGTLYTAQDGVFLGKKWSKTLIPLRAIFGIIAIFPLGATGFGVAQYIIYAMTYMGVGVANEVWGSVASQASAGALTPGAPNAALQNIYTAFGQMIFYDVTHNIVTASTQPPSSSQSLSARRRLEDTSAGAGANRSAVPPSCYPSGAADASGNIPVVCQGSLTKGMFRQLENVSFNWSGSTSGATGLLGTSGAIASACGSSLPWCPGVLSFINSNLSNDTNITDDQFIGNLNFLMLSPPAATTIPSGVVPYIQSDFELNIVGSLSPLVSPPENSDPAKNGSGTIDQDPVSDVYNASLDSSGYIETYSVTNTPAQLEVDLDIALKVNNGLSSAITHMMNAYNASTSSQQKPEDFSSSWWLAGDEYLYLDREFGQEMSQLTALSQAFLTEATKNPASFTATGGGVDASIEVLDLSKASVDDSNYVNKDGFVSSVPNGLSFTSGQPTIPDNSFLNFCLGTTLPSSPTSTTSCPYAQFSFSGAFSFSPSLSNYLTQLNTFVNAGATGWTANQKLAAADLLCKLGGLNCSYAGLSAYAPYLSLASGGTPQALDLTQGAFPLIAQDLSYYFLFEAQKLGPNGNPFSLDNTNILKIGANLYTLDLALNYALYLYERSNGSDSCPPDSSSTCNPNSPTWDNPMIAAGQHSPVANVMGFIFSGLVGAQYGTNNISGLLSQIWCVGEADFSKCMANAQADSTVVSQSIGSTPTGSGITIVNDHFSVIANAQLVGMNLIGGTVAALTNIYQTFTAKVQAVVASDQAASTVNVGAIAGMSLLGPAFGAYKSADIINAATAASVSIAALSVNLMWLPVIMIVLSTLFTTGVMFAVFIPMLPFVLFWAGKITWLLLVIEAIFAAPLMAMAMAYPEGHDLWGMGEQGFKISLNLLLMPVLMIVGLVSAMAITYFVLSFTADGFHYVSFTLLQLASVASPGGPMPSGGIVSSGQAHSIFGGSSTLYDHETVNSLVTQGIMTTFLIFMYATFISMAFNKCFSMIYLIPERVMSWIGSQGMKFGEKEGSEMQGAVSKQADQAAQAGGQAVSQGTQAQKALGDSQVSQTQQDSQAQIQEGQSIGQSVQQDIGTVASVSSIFKGGA